MEVMIESKRKYPPEVMRGKGLAIYAAIKDQYEPQYNGKILAIDVEAGRVYMGDTVVEALGLAKSQCPDHPCYVIRVGFDYVYRV